MNYQKQNKENNNKKATATILRAAHLHELLDRSETVVNVHHRQHGVWF